MKASEWGLGLGCVEYVVMSASGLILLQEYLERAKD
jgi:hypothetical protein